MSWRRQFIHGLGWLALALIAGLTPAFGQTSASDLDRLLRTIDAAVAQATSAGAISGVSALQLGRTRIREIRDGMVGGQEEVLGPENQQRLIAGLADVVSGLRSQRLVASSLRDQPELLDDLSSQIALLYQEAGEAPPGFAPLVQTEAAGDIISWTTDIVDRLLSWPAVVLITLILITLSHRLRIGLRDLIKGVGLKKLGAFGAEIEFSPEGARELGTEADIVFGRYRHQVDREYAHLVAGNSIPNMLEQLLQNSLEPCLKLHGLTLNQIPGFRSAIYVPDILALDSLRQLIPYYPKGSPKDQGRTFSIRYGIIGRAFRSRQNQYEPNVSKKQVDADLVVEWGLTQSEAAAVREKPCVMAVPLDDSEVGTVGVLYCDSTEKNKFGDKNSRLEHEMFAALGQGKQVEALVKALKKINSEIAKYSPEIKALK